MGITNLNSAKQFMRNASWVSMVLIFLGVYQWVYLPNQSEIRLNHQKVSAHLDSLDRKDEIAGEYHELQAKLESLVRRKEGNGKNQSWLNSSGQLMDQLRLSLASHRANVQACHEIASSGKRKSWDVKHVKTVFSCDLLHLFSILRDTEDLPRNVSVSRFYLDGSAGSQFCLVQMEFQIDLQPAPLKQTEATEILLP
ncbi:MAG: hypothetical protein VX438_15655 [Planctomycetota bacterium]|nr:hypothetical protein [Planctomycetota bacterium]